MAPMVHCRHQTDELPLVSHQLEVACSERPAEEGDGASRLVEDSTKPHTRGVAVHHEQLVEVRHLDDGPGGECALERIEGRLGLLILGERVAV